MINFNTLRFFVEKDRLSAYRVYMVIKDKFSGSIHPYQYKEIAKTLRLKQVDKQIKQLQDLGVLKRRSNSWFTITKRKDFAPSRANPSTEVNNEGIIKIHELRHQYYVWTQRRARYMASVNQKQKSDTCSSARTPGFEMSSSFIKTVSRVKYSERTVNKWLNLSKRKGIVTIVNTQQTLFYGDLQTCKLFRKDLGDDKTFIRKTIMDHTDPIHSILYPYRVVKFLSNRVSFCKV